MQNNNQTGHCPYCPYFSSLSLLKNKYIEREEFAESGRASRDSTLSYSDTYRILAKSRSGQRGASWAVGSGQANRNEALCPIGAAL